MKYFAPVLFILLFMAGCARHAAEKKVPVEEREVPRKEKVVVQEAPVPPGIIPEAVIQKAEKKYGYFARKRYEAYNAMLYELQNRSTEAKLEAVNDFFNRVPYGEDSDVWAQKDYWAAPLEFLGRDKGDCEDYVIAKYFALRDLGIPSDKLYVSYVVSTRLNRDHMVLSYFATPSSVPLILDNSNYKIFSADQRKDLLPVYNLNLDTLTPSGDSKQNTQQIEDNGETVNRWEQTIKDVNNNKF